jgi:hypothetical protein
MNDTAATSQGTEGVAFARSTGLPPSMGKATAELKCKVPDVVKDDFVRLAHSLGMSESELLREVVMLRLYGREAVARMQAHRLALVAGNGPEYEVAP